MEEAEEFPIYEVNPEEDKNQADNTNNEPAYSDDDGSPEPSVPDGPAPAQHATGDDDDSASGFDIWN